jgi:hypothetical protein
VGSSAAGFGLLLCLALGCAKQAEGERCDLNNGDLDCDTGLLCKGEAQLSIRGGKGIALCCPISGEITVDACRASAPLPDEMLETPAPVTPLPDAGASTTVPVEDAGALQPDATPAP